MLIGFAGAASIVGLLWIWSQLGWNSAVLWTEAQAIVTAWAFGAAGWYAFIARGQQALAVKQYREANKPIVVGETVVDPNRTDHRNYGLRNIGPGIAVNVYLIQVLDNNQFEAVNLGALGGGATRPFAHGLNQSIQDRATRGEYVPFLLLTETMFTRTSAFVATLNVLIPDSREVHHRLPILELENRRYELDEVLERHGTSLARQMDQFEQRVRAPQVVFATA